MTRYALVVSAFALAVAACGGSQEELANGDDPIAALGSTVKSSRYGPAYWKEQLEAESTVWKEALAYCADAEHANYPNCETVKSTEFIGKPGTVGNPALSDEGFNP